MAGNSSRAIFRLARLHLLKLAADLAYTARMSTDHLLPPDIAEGATLVGNEYGWSASSFPNAIPKAQDASYACLGGQFQFRLDDGSIYEMYWLAADSTERTGGESWEDYSRRSCTEVLRKFEHLMSATDFAKEASNLKIQIDATRYLVFVAYFVLENEWLQLQADRSS
jgi:hypothetical protein